MQYRNHFQIFMCCSLFIWLAFCIAIPFDEYEYDFVYTYYGAIVISERISSIW